MADWQSSSSIVLSAPDSHLSIKFAHRGPRPTLQPANALIPIGSVQTDPRSCFCNFDPFLGCFLSPAPLCPSISQVPFARGWWPSSPSSLSNLSSINDTAELPLINCNDKRTTHSALLCRGKKEEEQREKASAIGCHLKAVAIWLM